MSTIRIRRWASRTLGLLVVAAALGAVVATAADATRGQPHTLAFDVAEDGTRFVLDEAPVFDDGLPAYGNGFVTQGYIFEAGTLGADDGVTADGTVAEGFADKVIGRWTCYGYFVGDGARTDPQDGAWVVTTQVYEFDDGSTLVSVGPENPAGGAAAARAITGGTGAHALARGEVEQLTLGHNASDGVNATFTVRLAPGR